MLLENWIFARNGAIDSHLVNAHQDSNFFLRHTILIEFFGALYIFFGHLAMWVAWVPLTHTITPLVVSILHIIGMSSKPQMIRIHTKGIVTSMQNLQSVWYSAVIDFIGNMRSKFHFTEIIDDLSVATGICACSPQPTTIGGFWNLNLSPKALHKRGFTHFNTSLVSSHNGCSQMVRFSTVRPVGLGYIKNYTKTGGLNQCLS